MPVASAEVLLVSHCERALKKTMLSEMANVTTTGRRRRLTTVLSENFVFPAMSTPSLRALIFSSLTAESAINGENAITSHIYPILMIKTTHNIISGII